MNETLSTTGLASLAASEELARRELHEQLFQRVIARIHRYFWRLLRDADAAEECTQRTLLELVGSLRDGRFEAGRSFNTWIFLKAHKIFVGWLRERERSTRLRALPPLAAHAASPSARLDAEALLRRLPPRVAECVALRYEGGLTQDEVAAVLGCSRRTVVRLLGRARELFTRWRDV